MRHSIRRWLDWVMTNVLPPSRPRGGGQPVHLFYEKSGLTLPGSPIPWNAEAVLIEVLLRLPPGGRQRSDFVLRIPGQPPIPAESLRRETSEDRLFRIVFRTATPAAIVTAEITWKHRLLTTVPIPIVTQSAYLADLRMTTPTVAVRIDGQYVAARTFVTSQCKGLLTSLVLKSSTSLAPLTDLGIAVVFRSDRTGTEHRIPVPLTSTQMAAKEALLTAAPTKLPRTSGDYSLTWMVGDRTLLTQRLSAVTGRRFVQSLRVSEARFVIADPITGAVRAVRQPPVAGEAVRTGPCFVIASRESGSAGVVDLTVVSQVSGPGKGETVLRQSVLLTDGPTVFAPGLLEPSQLESVVGFELRHKATILGSLSFRPVPSAAINSEGAFKPAPDFTWSSGAEEELTTRLSKLMGGDGLV